MTLPEANQIFETISATKHKPLLNSLIKLAVRYSRYRVDWYLSSQEEQIEIDKERTLAHNAFIDACNILGRNMQNAGEDASWRQKVGTDRKDIGDFACLLHAIIGIKAR